MGNPKMTGFLIGIVLIGFFAGILGSFVAELSTHYNVIDKSSNVTAFNKLTNMQSQLEDYQDATKVEQGTPQFTDIVGAFFSKGYAALSLTLTSMDLFFEMVNEGLNQAGLGIAGNYLLLTITSIVIILIVVGIIISAIIKRDM